MEKLVALIKKSRKPRHSQRVHIMLVLRHGENPLDTTCETIYQGSILGAADPLANAVARAIAHPELAVITYAKLYQSPDEWVRMIFEK